VERRNFLWNGKEKWDFYYRLVASAAKKPTLKTGIFIASVNCCATQKQE
jgi:hypothetical protein